MTHIERKYDSEVAALIKAFALTPVGGVVAYSEMSKLVGFDITGNRTPLNRALRDATNEHGIVMLNVARVGYQRADDNDKASHTRNRVRRTYRMAGKGLRVARCVDRTKLDSSRRLELMAAESVLSEVARDTHGNHINAVERAAKLQHNQRSSDRLAKARALAKFDTVF